MRLLNKSGLVRLLPNTGEMAEREGCKFRTNPCVNTDDFEIDIILAIIARGVGCVPQRTAVNALPAKCYFTE